MTNYASIHGRLGIDPVVSKTRAGTSMILGSVVIDVPLHNSEDQKSLWIDILAFCNAVEALQKMTLDGPEREWPDPRAGPIKSASSRRCTN